MYIVIMIYSWGVAPLLTRRQSQACVTDLGTSLFDP